MAAVRGDGSIKIPQVVEKNAAYLAKNRSISIVDVVNKALSDAGYNNQTKQNVMIQSKDSAVLVEMKKETSYTLVYKVDEVIGSVVDSAVEDIKKFAHAVALQKGSIIINQLSFSTGSTDVIQKLHKANITAYVYTFRNEFTSIPMDFFSDPNMDMNAFIGVEVDGLITDYPATAKSFMSNACYDLPKRPPYIQSPQPGALLSALLQSVSLALPPAEAPMPSLTDSNVVEAPLPPVSPKIAPTSNGGVPPGPGPATSARSGAPQIPISVILYLAMFLLSLSLSVASYEFTTLTSIPGVISYRGANIQVEDESSEYVSLESFKLPLGQKLQLWQAIHVIRLLCLVAGVGASPFGTSGGGAQGGNNRSDSGRGGGATSDYKDEVKLH
ncbi:Glycerophosphodiester phosphodiesterase [Nymphaea thermarum]|nr:Glycerophosphodiester phosphodiesterase [Nymphaea thermarum]